VKNVSFSNGIPTQNWCELSRSCQMFKKFINNKTDEKSSKREVANMLEISFASHPIILTDNLNTSDFCETCVPCTE
jgi:hypothetical protein